MNKRKLEALRNLAERPGTDAEGEVARAMLERAEAARPPKAPTEISDLPHQYRQVFVDFLNGDIGVVEFVLAMRQMRSGNGL